MVAKVIPEQRTCLMCPNTFLVGGAGNGSRGKRFCSPTCSGLHGYDRDVKISTPLTVEQRAYLAGMIDADGHIGIYKHDKHSSGSRVILTVSNTDTVLLDWIRDTTGIGTVTLQARGDERNKTTYYWNTSAAGATSVLEQTLPYMIVKRARAELAVEYQEGLKDPKNRASIEWREGYRTEMLKLNKRGPVK